MAECSSCHATVKPTQKITPWVIGLLIILFLPGAILYVLTRPRTCPICGGRIQVPRASAPVTVRQETETPSPSNPAPSSPREVMAASWRRHRKMILISWGGVFGMVAVLASLLILASNGGDEAVRSRTGAEPTTAYEALGGRDNTQSTSSSSNDLAEIALHSGAFVTWYLGQVQPRCNQLYGHLDCVPIVREVKLGGTCGARVAGQMSWPSDLPDGKIYLVEMRSGQGDFPRYQQISAGSRYNELPDYQLLFDCWDLR